MKTLLTIGLFLFSLSAGAVTFCGNYDYVNQGGKRYNNNVWNDVAGSGCVTLTTANVFTVTTANHNKPTNGAPAAYPNVQVGCHWGQCSTTNPLPRLVSGLNSALATWTGVTPAGGAWNRSYDVWFNTTPTTTTAANGCELMVWLNKSGPIQPIGSVVATISLFKSTWQVWRGGKTVTYYLVSGYPGSIMELKLFINDAVARGYISPTWYLITVQAGFELWQGGLNANTSSFNLSVQ